MFSRILVGVDGSDRGASALAVATGLAVAERRRLTLMATVPHPSPWPWAGPISLEDLPRDSERDSEAALGRAAEAVPAQVPTTVLVRHGPAVDRLLDEVRRDHYDLIVVGSRHPGRLRSAIFGGLGHKLERGHPVAPSGRGARTRVLCQIRDPRSRAVRLLSRRDAGYVARNCPYASPSDES